MSAFTCFTNRCRILVLMAIAVVAHAVTMEPAPANILTAEKPIDNAWVESETIDGVVFYLGDWKSPNRVAVTRKPGQYQKVVYVGNNDVNFMKAEVQFANGDFDKAPENYKKATTTGKWNWEVEQAYRRTADCLARTGKGADALVVLKEYITRFPKNVHMAEVVSLRAGLALAAGDHAAAMADYQEMVKQGAKWSPTAELDGYLGQNNVLVAQKKSADAVALLNPFWAKLKADENPEAFGQVAIAVLLGGDEATNAAASKLARELILSRIDKDMKLSNEVRTQYRSYLSSL